MGLVLTATTGGTYVPVAEGVYDGEVIRLEQTESEQYGPGLKIYFKILNDDEYADKEVSAWPSLKFSEKAKLRQMAEALMAEKIEDGAEFDLETLIGRQGKIVVANTVKETGTFDKVTDVKPMRRGSAGAKSAAQAGRRF